VGDVVHAAEVVQVNKYFLEEGGTKGVSFLSLQAVRPSRFWQMNCEFPPNDNAWLVEIDKFLASPLPSGMGVEMEVTSLFYEDARVSGFMGTMKNFRSAYRIPQLPEWTYG
jgi:hypothetical protein